MREVKYGEKTSHEERSRVARQFLEEKRLAEALDLFLLAGDGEGIAEIRKRAIREGRPILLVMIARGGEHEVAPAEWKAAGDAAFDARRWREAFRCYTMAGDKEALARVQEKIPDYEIYVPQGKS